MGKPAGPHVRPTVTTDDDGQLITFHRACIFGTEDGKPCGVGLTSRNRYRDTLYCLEHGKVWERVRKQRRSPSAATRTPLAPLAARIAAPAALDLGLLRLPLDLQAALTAWLYAPGDDDTEGDLQAALRDHELKHRLTRAIDHQRHHGREQQRRHDGMKDQAP